MLHWLLRQAGVGDAFLERPGDLTSHVQYPLALARRTAARCPRRRRHLPPAAAEPASRRRGNWSWRSPLAASSSSRLLVVVLAGPFVRLETARENRPVFALLFDRSQSMDLTAGADHPGSRGPRSRHAAVTAAHDDLIAPARIAVRPEGVHLRSGRDAPERRYRQLRAAGTDAAGRSVVADRRCDSARLEGGRRPARRGHRRLHGRRIDRRAHTRRGGPGVPDGRRPGLRRPDRGRGQGPRRFDRGRLHVRARSRSATRPASASSSNRTATTASSSRSSSATATRCSTRRNSPCGRPSSSRSSCRSRPATAARGTSSSRCRRSRTRTYPTNNTDVALLRVSDEKLKVLYVEGLPRWDFRFLKNAMRRDTGLTGRDGKPVDIVLEAEWRRQPETDAGEGAAANARGTGRLSHDRSGGRLAEAVDAGVRHAARPGGAREGRRPGRPGRSAGDAARLRPDACSTCCRFRSTQDGRRVRPAREAVQAGADARRCPSRGDAALRRPGPQPGGLGRDAALSVVRRGGPPEPRGDGPGGQPDRREQLSASSR